MEHYNIRHFFFLKLNLFTQGSENKNKSRWMLRLSVIRSFGWRCRDISSTSWLSPYLLYIVVHRSFQSQWWKLFRQNYIRPIPILTKKYNNLFNIYMPQSNYSPTVDIILYTYRYAHINNITCAMIILYTFAYTVYHIPYTGCVYRKPCMYAYLGDCVTYIII